MIEAGSHYSVMPAQVISGLALSPGGVYVDGTYGRGGHAEAILSALDPRAQLWLIDRDPEAIATAEARHAEDPRCHIRQANFSDLGELLRAAELAGRVSGILLDLGVSSPQLDSAQRGFSFMRAGPLDMRMDNTRGETVSEWLARVDERTLVGILREYGEERYARRIAAAICEARAQGQLPGDTLALAKLIANAVPRSEPGKHPATRSFQAFRIFINGELEALDALLADVCELLEPEGRLVVISFHSLEDRRVKRFIQKNSQVGVLPPGAGIVPPEKRPRLRRIGRTHRPDAAEVASNPRARSAIMRIAERLP